jgi:glycosyltransferase involved in cell wall biosynthesis
LSNSLASRRDPPLIAQGLFSFQIGGSERVGAQLGVEYAARGYRVVCFAFYDSAGPFRDQLEACGVECLDLDYTTRTPTLRRLGYQLEFYRFLRNRRVDALHVHHATALILCGIPARLAGVQRVMMTEHAIFQLQERPNYRRSAARYCRYATAITGVHAGITDYFRDHIGVPADRLHVIPNGAPQFTHDSQARNRMRAVLGMDDSSFVCLYVGRLEAVKDLGTLLKAVVKLSEPARRIIRVLLAGDGSERTALESMCRSLGIGATVTFLGARSDVPALLGMADAFVMTSSTEGLPMALIEAMAAGLPCVATAVGGIPELLSGDAGLVVPPNEPEAVAHALTRLAGDEPLRRQIAVRALRKVERQYGLEPVVTSYLGLLGLPSYWPPDR